MRKVRLLMDAKRRRAMLILTLLSLGLAFGGQFLFARHPQRMWDGVLLYLLAVGFFVWSLALLRVPQPRIAAQGLWLELATLWQDLGLRRSLALGALAFALYAAFAAVGRSRAKSFSDLLAIWLVAVALSLAAFVDWRSQWVRLRDLRLRLDPETAGVCLVVLATFLLRVVALDRIPVVLSGDEASMGLEAASVIQGSSKSPFVTGWLSHPTLYFFIQALFLRLLGITTFGLRFSSTLIAALTVVPLYYLSRRFFGRGLAFGVVIFYATYHYAIHFGRLGINNIWDPLFALGVLFWVTRGLERGRTADFAGAGFCLGLCLYFYMGSRLIPIMLALYLLYLAIFHGEMFKAHRAKLAITALVALIVALPLLAHYQKYPNDLMARYNWIGIFPSGWVKAEMQRTGKTALLVFMGQWVKAALGYNFYPDPTFWYRPGIPLLQFVPSVFMIYGLIIALRRWREPGYFLPVLWLFLVVLFGGALMENPPTSPRLVLSIPAVAILVVVGIKGLVHHIMPLIRGADGLGQAVTALLVLVVCYGSVQFYFGRYTPDNEFGGLNTVVADHMGKYLDTLGPEYRCYFFGAPRMYYNFATIPYLAQGMTGQDVEQPLAAPPTFVNANYRAVFVFLPERRNELDLVTRLYPNGLMREFKDAKGQLLFISYEAEGTP